MSHDLLLKLSLLIFCSSSLYVFRIFCLSNVACKRYPKSANRLSDVWQFTTSDTPKVQSSEAIAVEEYLIKLYAAIIIV